MLSNKGSAYVFVRSASTWTQQAKLVAPDPGPDDRFGHDVAVSGDRIAVGAWLEDERGDASGSVYLFRRQQETWTLQGKLVASDTMAHDRFGNAAYTQRQSQTQATSGARFNYTPQVIVDALKDLAHTATVPSVPIAAGARFLSRARAAARASARPLRRRPAEPTGIARRPRSRT